jgi:hypothetical protein
MDDGLRYCGRANLINLAIAVFLPVTRHIVLAELHVIEF